MDLMFQVAGGVFIGGVLLGTLFYGVAKSLKVPADDTPGHVIACLLFPILLFGLIFWSIFP